MTGISSQVAAEAIAIAEKHLGGAPVRQRKALAEDIVVAIARHARKMAAEAVELTGIVDRPPGANLQ